MQRLPRHLGVRLVLLVASAPPLTFGAAAMVSGELAAAWASTFSLARIALTPELNYLLKPLGLYVLMFGGLMAYAIMDPVASRGIITWGALLLLLRGAQRLLL